MSESLDRVFKIPSLAEQLEDLIEIRRRHANDLRSAGLFNRFFEVHRIMPDSPEDFRVTRSLDSQGYEHFFLSLYQSGSENGRQAVHDLVVSRRGEVEIPNVDYEDLPYHLVIASACELAIMVHAKLLPDVDEYSFELHDPK